MSVKSLPCLELTAVKTSGFGQHSTSLCSPSIQQRLLFEERTHLDTPHAPHCLSYPPRHSLPPRLSRLPSVFPHQAPALIPQGYGFNLFRLMRTQLGRDDNLSGYVGDRSIQLPTHTLPSKKTNNGPIPSSACRCKEVQPSHVRETTSTLHGTYARGTRNVYNWKKSLRTDCHTIVRVQTAFKSSAGPHA